MKLSTALRDMINNDGIGFELSPFGVTFYGETGDTNPTIPDPHLAANTNGHIFLCTFTVGNSGVGESNGTGMTWGTSASGSIARADEAVSGTCKVTGKPRFFRIHKLTDFTVSDTFQKEHLQLVMCYLEFKEHVVKQLHLMQY